MEAFGGSWDLHLVSQLLGESWGHLPTALRRSGRLEHLPPGPWVPGPSSPKPVSFVELNHRDRRGMVRHKDSNRQRHTARGTLWRGTYLPAHPGHLSLPPRASVSPICLGETLSRSAPGWWEAAMVGSRRRLFYIEMEEGREEDAGHAP